MTSIFISYAHIDNEPLVDGQTGWVSSFHRVLEKRLTMLLGEQPTVWRDRELKGYEHFDQTIGNAIDGAAIFVPVITPRYLKSDYCQKELEAFCRLAGERLGGLRIGDKSRIFKVIKTPVDLEKHPTPIRGLLGYPFFVIEPERSSLRELAVDAPGAELREAFLLKLDDLAQEICSFFAQADTAAGGASGDQKTVYLAAPTSDVQTAHDEVKRELLEHGYHVLPDAMLALDREPFEQQVDGYLEQASLAVHVVGARYGFVPDGAERSSVHLQLERSASRATSDGLERVIWTPPDLATDDPRVTGLIEGLMRDPAMQAGASLLHGSIQELSTVVLDALVRSDEKEEEVVAAAAAPEDGSEGPVWVYLLSDQRDDEQVAAIEDALFDLGFEVRTPLFDGDESEVREEHEENLRLCEAFLVYYGNGGERWLRKVMGDLKKARGLGRTRPILAKAVVVGVPENPRKKRFRTHEAVVIDATAGFDPAALAPFLEPLRGRSGA